MGVNLCFLPLSLFDAAGLLIARRRDTAGKGLNACGDILVRSGIGYHFLKRRNFSSSSRDDVLLLVVGDAGA